MSEPRENESKKEFINRCIPVVINDGTAEDEKQAYAVCNSMWERKDYGMKDSIYLLDNFAKVTPGDPFRLFPFGKIVKDGKEIFFTPELAKKFKLPHFKPPIKRGSHREEAPAGGYIVGLEVREDGLYAIPEWNEPGLKTMDDGDYRYHSPEVVWDDVPVFENPETGEMITGPMIVGDALLHMPHLGEAAALYSVKPLDGGKDMTDQVEMVNVPKTFWEEFMAKMPWNTHEPEVEPEPKEPAINVDEFDAMKQERDEYRAKIEQLEAEAEKEARVEQFAAKIEDTKVNKEGLPELLAELPEEVAERVIQEFRALSEQINEGALLDEKGTDAGGSDDPREMLNALIDAKVKEGIAYKDALAMVRKEKPDLVAEIYG